LRECVDVIVVHVAGQHREISFQVGQMGEQVLEELNLVYADGAVLAHVHEVEKQVGGSLLVLVEEVHVLKQVERLPLGHHGENQTGDAEHVFDLGQLGLVLVDAVYGACVVLAVAHGLERVGQTQTDLLGRVLEFNQLVVVVVRELVFEVLFESVVAAYDGDLLVLALGDVVIKLECMFLEFGFDVGPWDREVDSRDKFDEVHLGHRDALVVVVPHLLPLDFAYEVLESDLALHTLPLEFLQLLEELRDAFVLLPWLVAAVLVLLQLLARLQEGVVLDLLGGGVDGVLLEFELLDHGGDVAHDGVVVGLALATLQLDHDVVAVQTAHPVRVLYQEAQLEYAFGTPLEDVVDHEVLPLVDGHRTFHLQLLDQDRAGFRQELLGQGQIQTLVCHSKESPQSAVVQTQFFKVFVDKIFYFGHVFLESLVDYLI